MERQQNKKTWADSSAKLTTPRSISTAATMDRSTISYDPYLSTHVFTKVNIHAPKPTDNIWIGVSHVFLPTFWCSKCNSWSSHANAVIHPVTGKEMEYTALMKDPQLQPIWTRGFGNECGRLFQGIRDIAGTDTCFFIKLTNIPKDRNIIYGKIVCDYKPHKKEKERVRLTVGGDRLDYSGDVATSTEDITTFKIPINSTLSTEDAAMMMMGIKNYYIGTPFHSHIDFLIRSKLRRELTTTRLR
jgi:hypothetical protein